MEQLFYIKSHSINIQCVIFRKIHSISERCVVIIGKITFFRFILFFIQPFKRAYSILLVKLFKIWCLKKGTLGNYSPECTRHYFQLILAEIPSYLVNFSSLFLVSFLEKFVNSHTPGATSAEIGLPL